MSSCLHVVACSKAKIWDKNPKEKLSLPARDVYQGGFFKQAIGYIKDRKRYMGMEPRWIILSAKYGFIEPDFKIENYNVSFNNKKDECVTQNKLEYQWEEFYSEYKSVFLWGGAPYYKNIEFLQHKYNVIINAPAINLPIGKALAELKKFRTQLLTIEMNNRREKGI